MVSGFDAPLVIDTPLGRMSREPKLNIAEKLPSYLKGKQITLLLTEEEYTPEVRKRIQKHVGKEYKIKFVITPNLKQPYRQKISMILAFGRYRKIWLN